MSALQFAADLVALLELERARALRIVEACTMALEALRPAPPVAVARKPVAKPRRAVAKPRLVRRGMAAEKAPAPAPAATADTSKVGLYRDAVVKVLNRYEHGADGAVIRREVAKECRANPEKDAHFSQDVGNALQSLRQAGKVDRSGTMWALVDKAASA